MPGLPRLLKPFLLLLAYILLASCVAPHLSEFKVVPQTPSYLLRSPDSRETPFTDVLRTYNSFVPGRSWMDLRPLMELNIENAYYQKGFPRHGLDGFLGTEIARYEVTSNGLHLVSFKPMQNRPEDDLPVQHLISRAEAKYRCQRLYFEVFLRTHNTHESVLLGANTTKELDELSAQLDHPETVCNETSPHCAVFPEACSVSVEIRIVVNGKPQTAIWGSSLLSLIGETQVHHLEMRRLYDGRLAPVRVDAQDPNALRLPLLPGDRISWN